MMDRPRSQTSSQSSSQITRRRRAALASIFVGVSVGFCGFAAAATPSTKQALGLSPVQRDVRLTPIPDTVVQRLEVRDIERKGQSGWEVVGPAGEMFRRFVDTNADGKIDRWCYYNNNVEVYRDVDEDFDGRPDQYRWLGTEGSRWGLDDNEDGRIDRWREISPEEVTAEIVAAAADGNAARFAAVVASPAEIKSLGLGKSQTKVLTDAAADAIQGFKKWADRRDGVPEDAEWLQFAAAAPGVLPAGTAGSTRDVTAYENVVAMYTTGGDQIDSGQILVGTLVKIGDGWRAVRLPSMQDDSGQGAQFAGLIFGSSSPTAETSIGGGMDARTQQLVGRLEQLDGRLQVAKSAKEKRSLHSDRADVIESLIESAGDAETRQTWVRQLVDTMGVAVQTGDYPDGVQRMRKISPKFAGRDQSLASYADYAAIGSEYVTKQTPSADFAKVQDWYLEALEGFVQRYPRTTETAKAYLQLALAKEFEEKESDALDYYKKVATNFPGIDEGQKAAGAVRRLTSVGKPIDFAGRTIQGKDFRLASLKGKPVVIHYWATWCEPCKQDMKLLRRLQAAYARRGLEIVGVNVDGSRDQAVDYLRKNPLPWTQLFADGGLESSPLANRLGVQTLPTMLLVDPNGRVVRHNVRAAELDDELAAMNKATRR